MTQTPMQRIQALEAERQRLYNDRSPDRTGWRRLRLISIADELQAAWAAERRARAVRGLTVEQRSAARHAEPQR